jgi:Icc protein
VLVVQISDPHIYAHGQLMEGRVDTARGLIVALEQARRFAPDLIILSGDLVNDADPAQYEHLAELLAGTELPLLLVAGNHDDRDAVRAIASTTNGALTPLPSVHGELEYDIVLPDGGPRFLVVDTVRADSHSGLLTSERLDALDQQLSTGAQTVVVQHHPPFISGIDFMDHYGLEGGAEELDVIARHRNVLAVLTGHLHRYAVHIRSGVTVITSPSSAAQVALDLSGGGTSYTEEPGSILLHRFDDAGVTSHVMPLRDSDTWRPSWAS